MYSANDENSATVQGDELADQGVLLGPPQVRWLGIGIPKLTSLLSCQPDHMPHKWRWQQQLRAWWQRPRGAAAGGEK